MRRILQLILAVGIAMAMFAGNAFAAMGEIVWVNKAERLAKVMRTDDGWDLEYIVVVPMDLNDPTYTPVVGDCVTFTETEGLRAINVDKISCDGPGPKSR